jgi:hypothetical protein
MENIMILHEVNTIGTCSDLSKELSILASNHIDARSIRLPYGEPIMKKMNGREIGLSKLEAYFLEIRLEADAEKALWLLGK